MSSAVDTLLSLPPFGIAPEAKTAALLPAVREELVHHYEHCPPFAQWCDKRGFAPGLAIADLAEIPFLPVNIFKRLSLRSVPEAQVVRVLTSSATSSQIPSRIALDQTTRNRQMRALAAILSHRIGGQRRPFIVLDAPPESAAQSDHEISARVAGMRGYLMAATRTQYVLKHNGNSLCLDIEKLRQIVNQWKAEGESFCILGYTYVLYERVIRPLLEQGIRLELPASSFVLHFGGWKSLERQTVSKSDLRNQAAEVFGLPPAAICDIYGFTEQLGVVYPDDASGLKRTPTYSEVFVRDPRTLDIVPDGEIGLLEFVCPLPHSYPGVAVLLDDLGRVATRIPGPDGMTGTAFEVVGRAPRAEIRGCGDTLPRSVYEGEPSTP